MTNAAAAYYTYLAKLDRERVVTLRRFGLGTSADYVELRARRYERQAKGAAPLTDAAPTLPQDTHDDTRLHTPSYSEPEADPLT